MIVDPKTVAATPAEPQLPELRFGLRQLFWFVTAACAFLALVVATAGSGVAMLAMLLASGVIVLHVTGTALGSRLRAHANQRRAWEISRDEPPAVGGAQAINRGPRSPLHVRDLPLRRMPLWIAAGAILGGGLGLAVLAATIGHRTSAAGVLVGAVSTAVVGAWFAFLGASFWAILRAGWRDAVGDDRSSKPGQY